MKCGRVQLQERARNVNKLFRPRTTEEPRRYCQKRLVNPDHEEDPRWKDVLERFHCNEPANDLGDAHNSSHVQEEDVFLSVQSLKFQGNEQQWKRPRTSFKYKTPTDGSSHRMFVKQVVPHVEQDDDRSSQLTCYFYDDYVKYLSHDDRSRPSSGKSSFFLQGMGTNFRKNKAVQVDIARFSGVENKIREVTYKTSVSETEIIPAKEPSNYFPDKSAEDTIISFHKTGKRKCLTISRAQSPETVHVIRVDVVCNTSAGTAFSDHEPKNKTDNMMDTKPETANFKKSHFTDKYLLTNTTKTLDENVSGGAKVTLLCKTFRLSDRTKVVTNKKPNVDKVNANTKVPK